MKPRLPTNSKNGNTWILSEYLIVSSNLIVKIEFINDKNFAFCQKTTAANHPVNRQRL